MKTLLAVLVISSGLLVGCRSLDSLETGPCLEEAIAGEAMTCALGGTEREYDLVLPADYNPETPTGLVIVLHGGGGNKSAALRTTCPWGDIDDPECLHAVATEHSLAVVAPNGTDGFLDARSWNAGGGGDDFRCVGGNACDENTDDIAFTEALIDDIATRMNLDSSRVYVTGISNGGAMAHRLACELPERITAIAAVGGANQFTTNATCDPAITIPILQVHGTEDPCWRYEGGEPNCPVGQRDKKFVSVARTMSEWSARKRCSRTPLEDQLPDTESDGTTTLRRTWQECATELTLLKIEGGGHTWPRGFQYLGTNTIGPVPQDWGNEVIVNFFLKHRR